MSKSIEREPVNKARRGTLESRLSALALHYRDPYFTKNSIDRSFAKLAVELLQRIFRDTYLPQKISIRTETVKYKGDNSFRISISAKVDGEKELVFKCTIDAACISANPDAVKGFNKIIPPTPHVTTESTNDSIPSPFFGKIVNRLYDLADTSGGVVELIRNDKFAVVGVYIPYDETSFVRIIHQFDGLVYYTHDGLTVTTV